MPPWVLNAKTPAPEDYQWELYQITADYSQANDLASKMPDKLKEMQALFAQEAKEVSRLPAGQHAVPARDNAPTDPVAGQTVFTYSGVMPGIPIPLSPSVLNRSFNITAEVIVPNGGGNGMIVTQGGWAGRIPAVPAEWQTRVHI